MSFCLPFAWLQPAPSPLHWDLCRAGEMLEVKDAVRMNTSLRETVTVVVDIIGLGNENVIEGCRGQGLAALHLVTIE